jgi:hypothetical protein
MDSENWKVKVIIIKIHDIIKIKKTQIMCLNAQLIRKLHYMLQKINKIALYILESGFESQSLKIMIMKI